MGGGGQVHLCVGCSHDSGRPVVSELHQYTHPEHRAVAQNLPICAPLVDTARAGSRHGQATDLSVLLQLEELWYEEKYRQGIQIHTRTASDLPMICCSGCTCKKWGPKPHFDRWKKPRTCSWSPNQSHPANAPCKGTNTQPSAFGLTVGFPCDCRPPLWHSRQSSSAARTSSGEHCQRPAALAASFRKIA